MLLPSVIFVKLRVSALEFTGRLLLKGINKAINLIRAESISDVAYIYILRSP